MKLTRIAVAWSVVIAGIAVYGWVSARVLVDACDLVQTKITASDAAAGGRKLSASDGAEADQFGFDVALSGNTAIIGSRLAVDVTDVSIDCVPVEVAAYGSDNWPVTWHTDAAGQPRQYGVWGDGGGFTVATPEQNSDRICRADLGVSRITGTFASHSFTDVVGCRTPTGPACTSESGTTGSLCDAIENQATVDGKSYGILSLDHDADGTTSIFMWRQDPDSEILEATLYESTDDGATWTNTGVILGEDFSNLTFIQMGKAYAANEDGFVYMYSPEGAGLAGSGSNSVSRVYLTRVAKANIKNLASYQYFGGTPGSPAWTSVDANKQPVFWYDEDADGTPDADRIKWVVSVQYHPFLKQYFLYNNSLANPAGTGEQDTDLDVWKSPTPWGPWTLLKRFTSFCASSLETRNLFSFFSLPAWDSTVDGKFKMTMSGPEGNDRFAVFAGEYVVAYAAGDAETTCRFAADRQSLTWDVMAGATQYNVYRGPLTNLIDANADHVPDGGYGTCQNSRDGNLTDTTFIDTDIPTSAQKGFIYLVGYRSGGVEVGLGTNSFSAARTESSPCP